MYDACAVSIVFEGKLVAVSDGDGAGVEESFSGFLVEAVDGSERAATGGDGAGIYVYDASGFLGAVSIGREELAADGGGAGAEERFLGGVVAGVESSGSVGSLIGS